MKNFATGILIAIFTFGFSIWFIYEQKIEEKPPCKSCSGIYTSTNEMKEIPFNELSDNLKNYDGQIIRVKARFHNDAGYRMLYQEEVGLINGIYTDLNNSDSYFACEGIKEKLKKYSGVGHWKRDGSADVIVVGKVGEIKSEKSFRRGDFGFEIFCVEEVSE